MRPNDVKRALLVAPLALLPVLLTGCGGESGHSPDGRDLARAQWQRLPDLPLSKRFGPVTANVGGRIVVVGGDTGPQCPANADCTTAPEAARDGAWLDPETQQWTAITPAPIDLPAFTEHAAVGDHLFVLEDRTLLDYDAAADRWRRLSTVSPWYDLVAADDSLVLVLTSNEDPSTTGAKDLVYDVVGDSWSALPPSPLGAMFDRTITDTAQGLVLSGQPLSANPQPTDPMHAALYEEKAGDWKRLADGTQTDRIDPVTAAWQHLKGTRLPRKDEWPIEQPTDPSLWENLKRPTGAPERIGPVAWIDDRVYVIGGAGFRDGATSDYDVRVWRITPHAALQ